VFEDSDDFIIDLVPVFSDVENGQDLIYLVSENIDGLSASIEDGSLTLSFAPDAYGPGEVVVTASDVLSSRLSVSTTFSVTINPVNDAPIIGTIENQSIDEGATLALNCFYDQQGIYEDDSDPSTFSYYDVDNTNGEIGFIAIAGNDDYDYYQIYTVVTSNK
jgi:hypothetical protein